MIRKVILVTGSLLTLMVISIYSKVTGKSGFSMSDFASATVYADAPSTEGTVTTEGSNGGEGSAEGSSEGSSGGSCSGGSSE